MLDERIQNCQICRTGIIEYYEPDEAVQFVPEEEPTEPHPVEFKRRRINYAFTGDLRRVNDGSMLYTGDFAPLFEAGPNVLHEFHTKMEQDVDFRKTQIDANRRIEQFDRVQQEEHDRMRSQPRFQPTFNLDSITATTGTSANTTTGAYTVPFHNNTDTVWSTRITSNAGTVTNYNHSWDTFVGQSTTDTTSSQMLQINVREGFGTGFETANWFSEQYQRDIGLEIGGERYEVRNALMKVFRKVPKRLYKKMTDDEKKMVKAKQRSEQLLKEWLSPHEYQGLKRGGQVLIPDEKDSDIIYIIKRDPNERIKVLKKGVHIESWCVVAKDLHLPVGDQLLSKFLQLKHDQEGFKKLAVKSRVR